MNIVAYTCHTTDRRDSKRIKILSHRLFQDADWWLWLDWNIWLTVPKEELVRGFEDEQIVGFRHSMRDCAYEEHAACARLGKDDLHVMRRQMDRYRRERYPVHYGLIECGVLLRRNSPDVREFNEAWWKEVENGSSRDQLSVGYASWKTCVKWAYWDGTVRENRFTEAVECSAI